MDEANAATWCESINAATAGGTAVKVAEKAGATPVSLLPPDVATDLASLAPGKAATFCRSAAMYDAAALKLEPIRKISGFNSRMDNILSVAGARPLEAFAGSFGAKAVFAHVTSDEKMKADLVRLMATWARAGALLDTVSCVKPGGELITTGKCTEWKDPEGRDRSGMKDATFTTFIGAGLVRAYYLALADAHPDELAKEHAAIRNWIAKWAKRLKRPDDVYFGLNMGWYWPTIVNQLAAGNTDGARQNLGRIEKSMTRLINDDGSITDGKTRGDRALWYHYTSIGEVVISMELMRAAGMVPSADLENRLHGSVKLFLEALDNPSILDKWAKKRRNSRYDGKQDWSFGTWPENDMAGSWLHVYPYRYAGLPQAEALRARVSTHARSATSDIDFGLGIGCVYNAAASAR